MPDRYTYENAGFNAFMLRSLKSNAGAQTVRGGISMGSNRGGPMAFDRQSVEGMLGDKLKIGRLILDGRAGRLITLDQTETVEIGWVGDLTE